MTDSAAPRLSTDALKSSTDVASLRSQLSNLQNDRERLASEVEKMNKELSTLKEGKREEMRKIFDNVIAKWLAASVNDENTRKQFSDGMERFIEKTNDNGLWTVAVEASNFHARQIEELEKLRAKCEQLETNSNGKFSDESSRKRARDGETSVGSSDFWGGLDLGL